MTASQAPALPPGQVLIDVVTLQAWMADGRALCVLDARSDPANGSAPGSGRAAWQAGHVPGALHADLDTQLSDHRVHGQGRHPLPDADDFARQLGRWGIGPQTWVVAHDAADGSLAAARLWWLLRLHGHQRVAVLDGGLAAWIAAGGPLTTAVSEPLALAAYPGQRNEERWLRTDQVQARLGQRPAWLLDARAAPRYAGAQEPIDPVAGHVPGALNLPYADMVADGRLRAPAQIRARVREVWGEASLQDAVLMCGSGVTACHLLLALEHAGLPGARVYPASWSGWIDDCLRPVAVGATV